MFNKLYKKTSNGKIQSWQIFIIPYENGFMIKTKRGYVDGKITEDKGLFILKGKNIGKANETTPLKQANLVAESKWKKKIDEGYVKSETVAENSVIVLPMLAQKFQKMEKHISYPCYVQTKLDGVRCISTLKELKVKMLSRKGKEFSFLDHIRYELKQVFNNDLEQFYLDGELYSKELTFQEIVGTIKKTKNKSTNIKKIEYHIYDCFNLSNLSMSYEKRLILLKKIFNTDFKYLKFVKTDIANNKKEVMQYHNDYVKIGWEGAIIRNRNLKYELDKRSKELLKLKAFQDDEYKIIDVIEATGNDIGTAIFICENNNDNQTFKCRPKGTREQRMYWFKNKNECIGELLTVEFFEKTDDGLPRFPVGKEIRKYE